MLLLLLPLLNVWELWLAWKFPELSFCVSKEEQKHLYGLLRKDVVVVWFKMQIMGGAPGWRSRFTVQLLILDEDIILWGVGSSPTLDSALTVWSMARILSLCLSAPPSRLCTLSKEINI